MLATLLDRDPGYDVDHDFACSPASHACSPRSACATSFPSTTSTSSWPTPGAIPANSRMARPAYGGSSHLTVAMIAHHYGVNMVHAARGSNLATTELIADRIDVVATDLVRLIPFARDAGYASSLSPAAGDRRVGRRPRRCNEQGLRGFYLEPWYGMYAPRGLGDGRAEQQRWRRSYRRSWRPTRANAPTRPASNS